MIKQLFALGIALTLVSCGTTSKTKAPAPSTTMAEANPTDYAQSITAAELKTMLYTYASDEFEGRDTGEKGQKIAVDYLKTQYQELGIKSPLGGDDYFQEVPLEKQKVPETALEVNGKMYTGFDHHVTLTASESTSFSVDDVAFVGYGIDAENYSDYENLDVTGKIVLAKAGEPQDENGNYITSGTSEDTKWTNGRQSLSSKSEAAKTHGAKGFILIDNTLFLRAAPYFKRQAESGASGRLSLKGNTPEMLMLLINEELGNAIYANASTSSEPKIIQTNLGMEVKHRSEAVGSENVVAYIEGSEKPNEIIVISAHLDHNGVSDSGEVYNGADDDGSGTVAIVEIAEAFKLAQDAGYGPKRSILFLHVTGEEKGLLGSRYYTDNDPIFPLENTVADLNIDMIGRTDPKRTEGSRNYVYLIGSDKLSSELHSISEEVNSKYTNIELDYTYNDENDPNRFYYRSDHYNFAKNDIPVIFYFNGTHDDYHKTSDTPDKIEYDLLENRTRLVFYTAWELANRADRIKVDKASKP